MAYCLKNLAALVMFAAVMYSPGHLIGRAVLGGKIDGIFGFLTRLWLGLACWIAFAFTACSLGFYRPAVFRDVGGIVLATAVLMSAWRWRPDWSFLRPTKPRLGKALLSGTLTLALPTLFLLALVPVMAWDCDTYHLAVPKLYTQAGGFRAIEFNVYSNWPLNTELLYGLAMQLADWHLANLVHWGIGCATLLAVYVFVRERGQRTARQGEATSRRGGREQTADGLGPGPNYAGLLAAVLLLGNPVVLFEFFVAYVDMAFAFFLFMCFWHLHIHSTRQSGGRVHLLLAGVAAGIMAGIKLSGLAAVVCIGAWFLWAQWRQGKLRTCLLPFLAFFVTPCLLLLAPWLAKSWYYTGNPVYPFMYDALGGPHWSSDLAARFSEWQRSIGMGRGLLDYVLLPIRVILFGKIGHGRFDGTINPLWIIWLPLAVAFIRRSRPIGSLLCVSLLYFIFWAASSQQMRFLIPILPLASVAAALAISDWLARIPTEKGRMRASAIMSAAVVASLVLSAAGGMREGAQFADKDVRRQASRASGGVRPALAFINEQLPATARIMFLNTNHGFFCERDYIADSFFEVSQLADWMKQAETAADLEELLSREGITHILWHADDYHIPYPPVLDEVLVDPARTEPIFCSEDDKDVLYTVLDSTPAQPQEDDRRQGGGRTVMPRVRGPFGMAR